MARSRLTIQAQRTVERDLLVVPADRGSGRTHDPVASASDDPILARLALWLADVAAEAARAVQRPSARPIRAAPRKARA